MANLRNNLLGWKGILNENTPVPAVLLYTYKG